ncbi:MAG: hypothetical protein ABIM45_05135 [candidate division WOR-3 bacterium]
MKFDLRGKFSISSVLSGRQRERTYSKWIAVKDTDYAIHDAIGDFYWAKRELRLEYELGYKRGIKPYLALGVGGNAEKLWVFDDSSHLGKSYSYSALGGIGAIGLDIYPFTLLKSLFEEARVKEEMGKIEKDFSLRLKLINTYYRKIRGERSKIGEHF